MLRAGSGRRLPCRALPIRTSAHARLHLPPSRAVDRLRDAAQGPGRRRPADRVLRAEPRRQPARRRWSACRTDPNLDPVKVRTAERTGGMSDDPRRKKAQACPPGRGVDDDDDGAALDRGDPEVFRPGHVEVAFERFFATPQLVRTPRQCPEDGLVPGHDRADRLPWTGAAGTRHCIFGRTETAHRLD